MTPALWTRLAALVALGGLASAAPAQPPPDAPPAGVQPPPAGPPGPTADDPAPAPARPPQVVRWPGGYLIVNGPETVLRQGGAARGRSTNVVTNSGNGVGNTVVVDGGRGGVTVVANARNGIGNRLILDPDDLLLDLDDLTYGPPVAPCKPAPADPVAAPKPMPAAGGGPATDPPASPPAVAAGYRGKANRFWSKKAWSEAHDCNLYWSPADRAWFRYASDDDAYHPVSGGPGRTGGGM